MMRPPPPADAPIAHWSAVIREEIMSNGGLSDTSAYRVASVRESLFVSLRRHSIRHWHELALGPVLEWAAEPRRDRSGEVLGDRNPDDIRHRMSSARHIIKAALRLRAPVPLLDDDGELRDFLHPPQRPERASDDPAEIVDAVAAWGPQRWRHGSLRNFDMVLPGVRELVLAAGPCNVDEARLWLRVLAGFALWAVNDQHSDPVTMHTPNNVETWVLSVNADQDDDWKNKAPRRAATPRADHQSSRVAATTAADVGARLRSPLRRED